MPVFTLSPTEQNEFSCTPTTTKLVIWTTSRWCNWTGMLAISTALSLSVCRKHWIRRFWLKHKWTERPNIRILVTNALQSDGVLPEVSVWTASRSITVVCFGSLQCSL